MTAEKDNRASVEQEFNRANPFEKVGIWAGYRLLQYIQSLGQTSEATNLKVRERHPLATSGRSRWSTENVVMGFTIAMAILLIGSMTIENVKRTLPLLSGTSTPVRAPYQLGVGPEQTNPNLLIKTLDRPGTYATYPYGVVINKTPGLIFQVDPSGLGHLLEAANLVPPQGSISVVIIGEETDDSLVTADANNKYEREQGKVSYKGITRSLSFTDVKKALGEGEVDLNTPVVNVELTFDWLRVVKQEMGLLTNSQGDPTLSPSELKAVTQQLPPPFRVLAVPKSN